MTRKLEDLIDIPLLQSLQDKLNAIYSFPSAIIDNDGKILTAVAWQDICTKFHRIHPESEKECIKSDKYILEHLHEAKPAVSYQCPHGLVDNAAPIIIDGLHLGNFFTGQFFLEKPDLEFFRKQAKVFGFDEKEYLAAVKKVPVWSKKKLNMYLDFIKGFIEIIAGMGLKNLKEIEINGQLTEANIELEIANKKLLAEIEERELAQEAQHKSEELFRTVFELSTVGKSLTAPDGKLLRINKTFADMLGYPLDEMMNINFADITHPDDISESRECVRSLLAKEKSAWRFEKRYLHKNGSIVWTDISTTLLCDDSDIPLYFITSIQDISEQKCAEAALAFSEEKFRMAFETNPDGVTITRLSDGMFLAVNEGFTSILGLSKEETLNKSSLDVEVWADPQDRKNIVDKLKIDGAVRNYEAKFRKKNGEILFGVMSASIIDLNGTQCILSFTRNVTEKKQAEDALKASELRFRSIIDVSPVPMALNDEEHNITFLNQAFIQTFGYTLEDIPSLSDWWSMAYPDPEYHKWVEYSWQKELDRAKQTGTTFSPMEIKVKCKNGIDKTVLATATSISGSFTGNHLVVLYDISERMLAEEALRNSEIRYRTLFNEAPFVVWEEDFSETKQYLEELRQKGISDFESYFEKYPEELTHCLNKMKLLDVNNTALSFYGASNFEDLKQNIAQTFTEESFQVFKRAIISLAENRTLFEEEATQRTFSGEIRHVFMRVFLPESEANTFSRVIVVMIDTTERMKSQEEIKKTNEELARINAQKDKFFSIIAHDLKSPFQGFLGLTELMAADASSFTIKELNEFSLRINKSANTLYELLVNLLEWAQMQKGDITFKLEELNLTEMTSKILDTLRSGAAQKEITLETSIPESLTIYADEKMIDSVIRNLLSNAIKFTPRGGGVLISARKIDSGKVEISVRDTGIGMSEEYRKKLFKIDEKVGSEGTEAEPSTGLGLLLCKEFVEKNGGTIRVESEEGKGSTFHFTISSVSTD